MFDNQLLRRLDPLLSPLLHRVARFLHKRRVHANHLTGIGFVIGMGCLPLLAFAQYDYALLCLVVNRIFDALDGALARMAGATAQGGFLDITLDFIFYSGFVLGASLAQPEAAIYGAFLIFSFVANGSAFLAFSIFATRQQQASLSTTASVEKSFHYLPGLAEGLETLIAFVLLCLFPAAFWLIALVFGGLCCLSAAYRIGYAYSQLAGSN